MSKESVRKRRYSAEPGCRCPSVEKCLNCDKAECNVVGGVPLDRSEIIAEINAGMLSFHALIQHDRRQGKRKKMTSHCRID